MTTFEQLLDKATEIGLINEQAYEYANDMMKAEKNAARNSAMVRAERWAAIQAQREQDAKNKAELNL